MIWGLRWFGDFLYVWWRWSGCGCEDLKLLCLVELLYRLWWIVVDIGISVLFKTFSRRVLTSATVLYMTDPSEATFMKCALFDLRP